MGAISSGRERVLRAARALFIERGYADVSMQQIADAARMTKAALYYHFRDKDDLFTQVILRELRHQWSAVERQLAKGGTFREQLEGLARLYFEQTTPDVHRMMHDYQQHVPEERHGEVHAELGRLIDAITLVFEKARDTGQMRDVAPPLAAHLFFHAVLAMTQRDIGDFGDFTVVVADPTSAARAVTSIVLHGIASSPEAERDPEGPRSRGRGRPPSRHHTDRPRPWRRRTR